MTKPNKTSVNETMLENSEFMLETKLTEASRESAKLTSCLILLEQELHSARPNETERRLTRFEEYATRLLDLALEVKTYYAVRQRCQLKVAMVDREPVLDLDKLEQAQDEPDQIPDDGKFLDFDALDRGA